MEDKKPDAPNAKAYRYPNGDVLLTVEGRSRVKHNVIRSIVGQAVEAGDIRMELKCGGEVAPEHLHSACFTLDKTKYQLRLSDETETSVKVWIERK